MGYYIYLYLFLLGKNDVGFIVGVLVNILCCVCVVYLLLVLVVVWEF